MELGRVLELKSCSFRVWDEKGGRSCISILPGRMARLLFLRILKRDSIACRCKLDLYDRLENLVVHDVSSKVGREKISSNTPPLKPTRATPVLDQRGSMSLAKTAMPVGCEETPRRPIHHATHG